jgi:uncharacterized protein (DUF39 family)
MGNTETSIKETGAAGRDKPAVVRTETEIWERLRAGATPESLDMDVAVFAFGAPMRGASAMILAPVAGRGGFTRAEAIFFNGVPAYPGPAPNERLGVVDALLFADQTVDGRPEEATPPGARVLLDILENKDIQVRCESVEGGVYNNTFKREQLEYARMVTYNTFLPPRLNIAPDGRPDEHLGAIRVGGTIFLNRAPGIVVGNGTRSGPGKASLSLSADMLDMDPACLSQEGDVLMAVAVPVPVTSPAVKAGICRRLKELSPEEFAGQVRPVDQEMAEYVKDLVVKGLRLTDSALAIPEFG